MRPECRDCFVAEKLRTPQHPHGAAMSTVSLLQLCLITLAMLIGIAPASAQVNCNAGYFGTEANAVEYNGRVYRTLAGTSPFDTDFYCQNYYLALPAGWSLAEDNADSRYVIGKYRWGTSLLVIASGRSYWTLNGEYVKYGPGVEWEYMDIPGQLVTSGSTYEVGLCGHLQILISKPGLCTPCPGGTYSAAVGASNILTCITCPAGTYSPAVGWTTCIACPSNSTSPSGASGGARCTCNAGFAGPDGGTCTACAAGKYKSGEGNGSCTDCGSGKYGRNATGQTTEASCTACSAGKYWVGTGAYSQASCTDCTPNSSSPSQSSARVACTCNTGYGGDAGTGTCTACVAGKYKPVAVNGDCTDCDAGKYGSGLGQTAEASCTNCAANSNSPRQSTACTCNAGFGGDAGRPCIACTTCVASKYKSAAGNGDCSDCGAGKYGNATGQIAESSCMACGPGKYRPPPAIVNVTSSGGCSCPTSPSTSPVTISDGPSDYENSANCRWLVASDDAISLSFSSFVTEQGFDYVTVNRCTSSSCSTVQELAKLSGSFVNLQTLSTTYTSNTGYMQVVFTSDRLNVASGFIASLSTPASSTCLVCPANSDSSPASSSLANCTCNAGYTGVVGKENCTACVAGKYKTGAGNANCTACGVGKYGIATGQTAEASCTACTANSSSPPQSSARAACTCNAGYGGDAGTGTCTACVAGKYDTEAVNDNCMDCGAGKFGNATGQTAEAYCTACGAGKYGIATGQTTEASCTACGVGKYRVETGGFGETSCTSCTPNSTSPSQSSARGACICDAGYLGNAGTGTCTACPSGKYKDATGSAPCTSCASGTYSQKQGATTLTTCLSCPAGKYGFGTGQTAEASCTDCTPNSNSPSQSSARAACTCDTGHGGDAGTGTCTACVAGKYKNATGSAPCTSCASGTYSRKQGATTLTTCLSCPANADAPLASSAFSACTCNAGFQWTYRPRIVIVTCSGGCSCPTSPSTSPVTISDGPSDYENFTNCRWLIASDDAISLSFSSFVTEQGFDYVTVNRCTSSSCSTVQELAKLSGSFVNLSTTYTSYTGYMQVVFTSDRLNVASGFIASLSTAEPSTCLVCPANSDSSPGKCSACNIGTYKEAPGSANCSSCPDDRPNSPLASTNISDCSFKCGAGTSGPDGGPCTACDAGKFKNDTGNATCTECSPGSYAAQNGLRLCKACIAGTFSTAVVGASTCVKCEPGTYSTAEGASTNSTCGSCPMYSNSPAGSAALTSCTCNAGYSGKASTSLGSCAACIAGKWKPAAGNANCTDCGAGKYGNATGQTDESSCSACGAGKYRLGTGGSGEASCTVCTLNSTSPPGSSALAACTCDAGYGGFSGAARVTCSGVCGCLPSTVTTDGTISDGPSDYVNFANCMWLIESIAVISLSFTSFNTESGYDFVTINHCSESSCTTPSQVAKLSGDSVNTSTVYTSTTGFLQVVFTSDRVEVRSGFVASWRLDSRHTGTCTACVAGKYKSAAGNSYCTACGAGKYGIATGQTAEASCTACGVGKYRVETGGFGETSCTSCTPNSTSPSQSSARGACICDAGYLGNAGTGTCTACPSGKYKDATGSAPCTSCASGTYSQKQGATTLTTCLSCPAGKYGFGTGQTAEASCTDCTPNSNSPSQSSARAACTCDTGHGGDAGTGTCTACVAGKYKSVAVNGDCTDYAAVWISLSLPMAKEKFDENRQVKFRLVLATVAAAAGVRSTDVTIVAISEMMAGGVANIRVDSIVEVTGALSADSVQKLITADSINAELSKVGLPNAEMLSNVVLPNAKMLDLKNQAGSNGGGGGGSDSVVIGGLIGGIGVFFMLVGSYFLWRRNGKVVTHGEFSGLEAQYVDDAYRPDMDAPDDPNTSRKDKAVTFVELSEFPESLDLRSGHPIQMQLAPIMSNPEISNLLMTQTLMPFAQRVAVGNTSMLLTPDAAADIRETVLPMVQYDSIGRTSVPSTLLNNPRQNADGAGVGMAARGETDMQALNARVDAMQERILSSIQKAKMHAGDKSSSVAQPNFDSASP